MSDEPAQDQPEVKVEVQVDVLGEPWTAETIELGEDHEGPVVATLVSRRAEQPTGRALLHVHGFADYFFHAEMAEHWLARGYDVYALDLRKYGRSLREWQTPTYAADLGEYDDDLAAAWQRVVERDGHDHVVVSAHSTGGLTVSLWLDAQQPEALAGVVLNSPWLDLQGSLLLRTAGTLAIKEIGRRQPMRRLGREANGVYGRSLHRDHGGEWDYDLTWKPLRSFPLHFGWLRAIRVAHARLQAGLDVPAPVLVLSSDRSATPSEVDDDAHTTDIVLDVEQIRRWSTAVGRHVTYVAVPGAKHDVVLSREPARSRAYAEIDRWHAAYVSP